MKPDWDKLMKEFKDNKDVLIADVDCTADGKPLCSTHGVQGFPTLKWGNPAALEDYQGGRDFDSLKTFAEENLKPMCGPFNLDLSDAEDLFTKEVEKLQKAYEKLQSDKEATIKEV